MREFSGRGPALDRLDRGARLVYSAFLVFLAFGLLSAAVLHWDGMKDGAAAWMPVPRVKIGRAHV